ncbi:imidazole glycerol phosphate synthase subunit HisH [Vampirovibrio chlorellavorus]|uniref:imidazole glycerol phosphate synthase subunit HisH n=1 Tax=Vampirovibrio chlorellavorus TaxID=758823 RepID=UPI0026EB1E2E|nr:imidazole glycerol phosphate synthase subunit HisH [Vampirovibrio chlorellavorus]
MKRRVSIVDYGMGNLFSVSRALEHCGADPVFVTTPVQVAQAERLILPGVGAFADGMAGLKERGLVEALRAYHLSGKPLLGICLGMQMLLETNEEFGLHQGLGLLRGKVTAIPKVGTDQIPHKIPHIGWNSLSLPPQQPAWERTILAGIPEQTRMYFVHSYTAFPTHEENRLADADYNGQRISAVVHSGNLFGCQFHPEKSGPWGLKIIENFINLN